MHWCPIGVERKNGSVMTRSSRAGHSGRIAGCVTDGVDDDLGLPDLVENEIGVRRRRHPANRRIARAASDVRML